MITPDIKTVSKLSKTYTYIPLYEKIPLGKLQVVTLYEQFRGPTTCVVELQEQANNHRYTIIGLQGNSRFVSDGALSSLYKGDKKEAFTTNPIAIMQEVMKAKSPLYPELPVFTGGIIGHVNYDTIRLYENIGDSEKNSLGLPMLQFMFIEELFVIDEKEECMYVIVNIEATSYKSEYERATQRIKQMIQELPYEKEVMMPNQMMQHSFHSNMKKEQFLKMVKQAKEYITQGEIFQVVLSQRLESDYKEDPFLAYRKLRALGNSPYLYYLDFNEYCIAGMSPEMLVKAQGTHIQTMPIAGTRKRGKNLAQDKQLMKELEEDQKEVCEHMMLVDLARNDMGRVAQIGSIQVEKIKRVKLYSHVMHMTTCVHALLDPNKSAFDALMALFPAGTLSGAPKIRAMQIIDELEHTRREVYGGAIAFVGYNGIFDTCITIRTLLFHKQKVYVQAGAGIVKDSDPQKEYQETLQKCSALLEALGYEVTI